MTPRYVTAIHRDLGKAASPSPVAFAIAELGRATELATIATTDFVHGARELAAATGHPEDEEAVAVTLADGEGLAAVAKCRLPVHENRDLVRVKAHVRPGLDATELLDAAWPTLTEIRAGRPRLIWDENAAVAEPGTGIPAATGVGELAATPVSGWLLARGFLLAQAVLINSAPLPGGVDKLAGDIPEGFRLLSWVGAVAADIAPGVARLRAEMSHDLPTGAIRLEDEVWDVGRLARENDYLEECGRRQVWSAAQAPSGEVVGYTTIDLVGASPFAFQQDTFVSRGQRGRGLGLALKQANTAQLSRVAPHVTRIHTFNAGENRWMIDINRSLGYRPIAGAGHWTLPPAGQSG